MSLNGIHSRAFRSARGALDRALHRENPNTKTVTDDDSQGIFEEGCPCALLPMIAPEADSAHVTGFHHAGDMSRYNVQREGIVFSDNQCSCSDYSDEANSLWEEHDDSDTRSRYLADLSGMFWSLHGIADRVLLAIENKLELSSDNLPQSHSSDDLESNNSSGCDDLIGSRQRQVGWFQRHMGPTETASQWHMKRFVIGEEEEEEMVDDKSNNGDDGTASNPAKILRTETGERITLPMHTDPSLISVVIHDSYGERKPEDNDSDDNGGTKEAQGALGLQYYHPKEKRWEEPEAHGHSVATIFVGSVLAHLTCGKFPAAKHRVVEVASELPQDAGRPLPKRMAATLFVRPQPSALLRVPLPSPWLLQQIEEEQTKKEIENNSMASQTKKKKKSSAKPPITFDAWLKRVAKNYEKQKKKQKNKNRKVI
jgi:hypothetical protein